MSNILYIVGRRQAGKSYRITDVIGSGKSTLIIVETEHDKRHHSVHSPEAKVIMRSEASDMLGFDVVVLDNVICSAGDSLLQKATSMGNKKRLIVAASHPNVIPLTGSGSVLQLSDYEDECGLQCLYNLKATYAFQLAAKLAGTG